jgi:hypothetical protein
MQYSGQERGHHIRAIEDEGMVLVLEDKSRWGVYEGFASRAIRWQVEDMIGVKPCGDKEFPYLLVNVNSTDSIECKLLADCCL